jgi:hypothetical protein
MGLWRRSLCVSGTPLVVGVEDYLVTGGKQSTGGHQAKTVS